MFYAYFGYPLILLVLSTFRKRSVRKGDITPPVSLIITAYNEERRIAEKIANSLEQDYPREKLEIIVASDCSTDKTDEIVRSHEAEGVRLVRAPEKRGKENAQKCAVHVASGKILIFSDAATRLASDGVSNIVRNFHDPSVGCVSSADRFISHDGKTSGEALYVKYEMFLRLLETKVNSLVGLSGSFFAARKDVCQEWAPDLQSDFNTLMNSVKMGLRGVLDPESIGYYKDIADPQREFDRKVRTVLRGISVLMKNLPMLNPWRYGLFSWQLFSHKLCRWLVPFAMGLAFVSNVFLAFQGPFYRLLLVLQILFYILAMGGMSPDFFLRTNILKVPTYFLQVNLSILSAWYRYLLGERIVSWHPSER
jgi:cellulose synthase/poly-beta-1,6-N-acetylglucosamine synthase-like glycosyltransferase